MKVGWWKTATNVFHLWEAIKEYYINLITLLIAVWPAIPTILNVCQTNWVQVFQCQIPIWGFYKMDQRSFSQNSAVELRLIGTRRTLHPSQGGNADVSFIHLSRIQPNMKGFSPTFVGEMSKSKFAPLCKDGGRLLQPRQLSLLAQQPANQFQCPLPFLSLVLGLNYTTLHKIHFKIILVSVR